VEVRVFVTAFNPKDTTDGGLNYDPIKPRTLKDEADLLAEIQALPRSKAQRKVPLLLGITFCSATSNDCLLPFRQLKDSA